VEYVTATRHQVHLCTLALWLVLAGSSDPWLKNGGSNNYPIRTG
jgi:hypothetical protein